MTQHENRWEITIKIYIHSPDEHKEFMMCYNCLSSMFRSYTIPFIGITLKAVSMMTTKVKTISLGYTRTHMQRISKSTRNGKTRFEKSILQSNVRRLYIGHHFHVYGHFYITFGIRTLSIRHQSVIIVGPFLLLLLLLWLV